MTSEILGASSLTLELEHWPLARPLQITGYRWDFVKVLRVSLRQGDCIGQGEAAGVYFRNDRPESMFQQLKAERARIEKGISRGAIQSLLPPGGARNALDCALWDLEARIRNLPAWRLGGLAESKPLLTTFTCGADEPERMALAARQFPDARAIKLKLTGDSVDADRVLAVRNALPEVWLGVDANQGLTHATFDQLLPTLTRAQVALIEQPFPIGQEALLDGLRSPIPIAADESVQTLSDVAALEGRFQVMNIKLDKCGGLTEGLAMARAARDLGLECMVGNMLGTSLAMAPAYVLGQLCQVVDLDGPMLLKADRARRARYQNGCIDCSAVDWGGQETSNE